MLAAGIMLASCGGGSEAPKPDASQGGEAMKLTSSAFATGQVIPDKFTCTGAGTSPPLVWSDPPAGTKSFALLVEDPDAPGGTFRHWGVYDLAPDRSELAAGAGNGGADGLRQTGNDFGNPATAAHARHPATGRIIMCSG